MPRGVPGWFVDTAASTLSQRRHLHYALSEKHCPKRLFSSFCRSCITSAEPFTTIGYLLSHALKQTHCGVLKVAWSKVLNFTDPDQYTAAVRAADMQVFTTAKGEFRAELTQVVMNKLWMQRFRENLPRVHKGAIRHGRRVFNFLTEGQPEVYNRGRVMSPGEICADDFDVQHVRTLGGYRLCTASLGTEAFASAYKAIIGCVFVAERGDL